LVDEITTLCHHLEANHSGKYCNWAKSAKFLSKLPGDVKKCKEADREVQHTLDRDLQEKDPEQVVVPYSDKLFHQTAVKWVAATDQPIQALEHPIFKELVDVTARAKNGVKIPGQKATRGKIKRLFKDHLTRLRTELNVSNFFGSHLFFSHHFALAGSNCLR
ncbi:hypothetical protein DFH94DRAFT_624580, partial [Russula ochroleuca]